jgi:hypothetical protein
VVGGWDEEKGEGRFGMAVWGRERIGGELGCDCMRACVGDDCMKGD